MNTTSRQEVIARTMVAADDLMAAIKGSDSVQISACRSELERLRQILATLNG